MVPAYVIKIALFNSSPNHVFSKIITIVIRFLCILFLTNRCTLYILINVLFSRIFLQVIFAIVITWLLSIILTATNVFPNDPTKWGYEARTDLRTEVIFMSPWFRVPYPGLSFWHPSVLNKQ